MREVVLLPRARAAIERLPVSPEGWLFLTQRMSRFTQRNLHYYWDPVRRTFTDRLPASHWLKLRLAERGIGGNLDFYELRHFFGTALAQPPAGIRPASPYEIAKMMGHKDGGQLAMKVYIHAKERDVIEGLSAAWAEHAPRARRGAA
jgi:integrase